MNPRLLAVDLDGTLLDRHKRVSERSRRALDQARGRGVRVAIVTGRRWASARDVLAAGGVPHDAIAAHNGAIVVADGRLHGCLRLTREVAVEALGVAASHAVAGVAHVGGPDNLRLLFEASAPARLRGYLESLPGAVDCVADLTAALGAQPLQLMFSGSCAATEALAAALESLLGGRVRVERTVYAERDLGILDVLHPGAGKARAVATLCGLWGVDRGEVVAIGDNWNDRELLEWAGLGLLMGNADPALRAGGLGLLPGHDQDGVAHAVEREILRA